MQNIDPFLFLEPALFILLGAGTVVYWRLKRRLTGVVLLLSLVAYAAAIALKEVIQAYSAGTVTADFGYASWQTGIYYGLQTCFLEVGFAYLVARYAVGRKLISDKDAQGYGVSLAFWENAILIGALSLVNLVVTYALIGNGLLPQSLYDTIVSSEPDLLFPPQQLLVPIVLATLERVSSFLAHFAWGYLTVLAASLRKPAYFLVALPMGLIDALVPFAQLVPTWEFELVVFVLCLGCVGLAWRVTRGYREDSSRQNPSAGVR